MAEHKIEAKNGWDAVMETLENEKVERYVDRIVKWLRMARRMEREVPAPGFAVVSAQRELANVGMRRIEQLRRAGKFDKADRALELTQEYFDLLKTAERSLLGEELCAYLEQRVKEFEYMLLRME